MYAIWTKLALLEDLLLDDPNEVVNYLRNNYYGPPQQIRSMVRERAESLKKNSSHEITDNASSFHILPESDSPFDSTCDYVGLIFYSYHGKNEFTLNEHQCKRGDILIKDKTKIPASNTLRSMFSISKQPTPTAPYESLYKWYFKKSLSEQLVAIGITYELEKWMFNAITFGPEPKQAVFSPDEYRLLEMLILTWTKGMNDETSIRMNARKMLNEQLNYIKDLLETQRPDMEKLWTSEELSIAITTFEHEIQDEIAALFQTTSVPNTFANLRELLQRDIQLNDSDRIKSIAETLECHQLPSKILSSKISLCDVWKQLKTVENYLRESELATLFRFLQFENTFPSIESLFSVPVPPFLHQLGICPESDPFDATVDHIGLLIYQYNGQNEFTLNGHQCKRGQILICQKRNILGLAQASLASLLIHEYLYEWYFYEKPNELFYGIGFSYEQSEWKFSVITYAGLYGIHSNCNTRGENPMAPDMNEQHSVDLALSALYISNKWRGELGRMYTVDELEKFARNSFQEEIEIIDKLFQKEKATLTHYHKNGPENLNHFIQQCRLKLNSQPIISKNAKTSSPHSRPHSGCSTFKDSSTPLESETHPASSNLKPSSFTSRKDRFTSNIRTNTLPSSSSANRQSIIYPDNDEGDQSPPPLPRKELIRIPTIPKRDNSPSTTNLYQLWKELCSIEAKMLRSTELTEFIQYLTKKEYINMHKSTGYIPPSDKFEEYTLMAKIKIDAQLEYIHELFRLKESKLSQQKSDDHKKLMDAFIKYYKEQIEIAKKNSK